MRTDQQIQLNIMFSSYISLVILRFAFEGGILGSDNSLS